jgi:hypothetical protein
MVLLKYDCTKLCNRMIACRTWMNTSRNSQITRRVSVLSADRSNRSLLVPNVPLYRAWWT